MKKKRVKKIKAKRIIIAVCSFFLFSFGLSTYLKSYSEFVTNIQREQSGVVDNVVYVNDAASDYYYYTGKNYTQSSSVTTLPSLEDKNYYNYNNLLEINITYSGADNVDPTLIGYVSPDERQNTYVYYKVIPVETNGTTATNDDYAILELIDNPFADHPNNYGFNGWVTTTRGVEITMDTVHYIRYAKIPVTYTNNKPDPISITFYAKWVDSPVERLSQNNSSWTNAFSDLENDGFVLIGTSTTYYEDMSPYYVVHYYNTGYYGTYPNGALDEHLNDMSGRPCRYYCTFYTHAESEYSSSNNYYEYNAQQDTMVWHNVQTYTVDDPGVPANSNIAGYYKQVLVQNNQYAEGLYDSNGNYVERQICYNGNGCPYYELQYYYKPDNTENVSDGTRTLYYKVTRDTNIIVLDRDMSSVWGSSQNKPFTLTGIYDGESTGNYLSLNSTRVSMYAYNDTRVEHIILNGGTGRSTSDPSGIVGATPRRVIFANYNNLMIGRGIEQSGTNVNATAVIGANTSSSNQGSSTNPKTFRMIVESGIYSNISASHSLIGNSSSKPTIYINSQVIIGNDYDRVTEENDNLEVYENLNGTFGGKYVEDSDHDYLFDTTLKSGKVGTSENQYSTGIYVGGRGYSSDTINGPMRLKIEGGWVYNVIGGPLVVEGNRGKNVVEIYMTGGEVESIYGGAGDAATYGNRIISVTGGTVNYSVFGGSNGYQSADGRGTLNGSTYVYIGGVATIGSDDNMEAENASMYGAAPGCVFGIGNGRSGYDSIGSCDNSNIVINDGAKIQGNVYGGGNYGATGVSSSSNSSTTNIKMVNGTVSGSIYGGGNNNGSGSSSKTSTVNVTVENGTVTGNVYGGSRARGRVYGSTNVTVTGGTITNVYGGGEGGYTNNTNYGTFVTNNVNVVIGDANKSTTPTITKVYGGSAFGTVNGSSNTTTVQQNKSTKVTVNKGNISYVYGGGEGDDTYTPYVEGAVEVTVNGGTITNVFGGNDAKGTPNGAITVNINGGTTTNTYGGGHLAPINTSTVNLNGGTSTNVYGGGHSANATTTNVNLKGSTTTTIYGGSNESGTVTTSNITTTSGSATTIFGGNNLGGTTTTSNVTINGGTIGTVYGGGNEASTGTTRVNLLSSSITNVYGGGNKAGVTNSTNITLNGSTVTNMYGGSNESGTVAASNITATSGNATTVYGGNNLGGTTTRSTINANGATLGTVYGGGNEAITGTTQVNLNSGTATTIYGGGNKASTGTTVVNLNNGTATDVYGGGNEAGVTTSTRVNLSGSQVTNIYGGSNKSGDIPTSTISTTGGSATTVYGGNNLGGTTTASTITVNGGTLGTVYGGGNEATTGTSSVTLTSGSITNVYGGGNKAGMSTSATVAQNGATVTNIYGGSNQSGTVPVSYITTTGGTTTSIYGGNNQGGTTTTTNITTNGGNVNNIYGGGNKADSTTTNVTINGLSGITDYVFGGGNEASVTTANVTIKNGVNIQNVFGGSNSAGTVTESNVLLPFSAQAPTITNVYGGNNNGGKTLDANVEIRNGTIANVYGGGNNAATEETNTYITLATVTGDVFGGGNRAAVETTTTLKLENATVNGSVYGGGNLAEVYQNTDVFVSDSVIGGSLFAGGNGAAAVVRGNTLLNIEGATNVTNHVFGGGNAAATGTEQANNSTSVVNIAGLTCGGNVYGGANTSVLYGTANVNIGKNVLTNQTLKNGTIDIGGTVFGGGEANASGSEIYDFSFISVTTGIDIKIDAAGYQNFDIHGSIFGSGNASSTTGYSNILIRNYGTEANYKTNVSLQRASSVILDNSVMELIGTTDRTNEYSDVLFSLSRLDEITLANNSVLYLKNSTNLVKAFNSALISGNTTTKETISINDDTGAVTRNVNNKLYIYEGRNVNIATNENITSYGRVSGMTFFGMFNYDRDGRVETGYYDTSLNNTSSLTSQDLVYFIKGSYVLGSHHTNHNFEEDGFYSNFPNKQTLDRIKVDYIVPTPDDSDYYMWAIGEQVTTIEISLTASKYSTLGTYELPLVNFSEPNTTFTVLGFNYNELESGVELVPKSSIPRIAASGSDADNIMGLVMQSSDNGWITRGSTTFLTDGSNYDGTKSFLSDNSSTVPTFLFYLYHSKNLETRGDMGSATISMVALVPIDDLNSEVRRVNIVVNLSRALFTTDDYEGTITAGKKYEMFAPGSVHITTTSSFTTYYSLFVEKDETIYKPGYHHVLSSTYNFPANTKITMIDLISGTTPEYYYYVVTNNDYVQKQAELLANGDVSYELSNFIRMGSSNTSNHFDEDVQKLIYYNSNLDVAEEEFIFIVDFKEAGIQEDVLNKSLSIELRSADNEIILSVIGVEQQQLFYNLYYNKDSIIEVDGHMSTQEVYIGEDVGLNVRTNFVQGRSGSNVVVDTNFNDYKSGIKLSILDSNGDLVNGPSIFGLSYTIGTETYWPRFDGTVRINVAERIANVNTNITINTAGSNLASGNYTLLIESFASPDGIYYGLTSLDQERIPFEVKNTLYGLKVTANNSQLIINKTTGLTEDETNAIALYFEYSSGLLNPNLRVSLHRREYDQIYQDTYLLVDFKDFFTNDLATTNLDKVYMLFNSPQSVMSTIFYLKENLTSGTYRLQFSLYDNDTYIGEVHKYIIIK